MTDPIALPDQQESIGEGAPSTFITPALVEQLVTVSQSLVERSRQTTRSRDETLELFTGFVHEIGNQIFSEGSLRSLGQGVASATPEEREHIAKQVSELIMAPELGSFGTYAMDPCRAAQVRACTGVVVYTLTGGAAGLIAGGIMGAVDILTSC